MPENIIENNWSDKDIMWLNELSNFNNIIIARGCFGRNNNKLSNPYDTYIILLNFLMKKFPNDENFHLMCKDIIINLNKNRKLFKKLLL